MRYYLCLVGTFYGSLVSLGQDCDGGQIYTVDTYLYGRFEVSMKSAEGNGVVSSFFLYNLDTNCNWPEENNEIDVEMTGDDENLQFTTHHPFLESHTEILDVEFNPHDEFHEYAIEWEPNMVRWFIDGEMVYFQDGAYVLNLVHPMRIMMNLWAAEAASWVGVWEPSIMPLQSEYEYVKCYELTPGSGDSGTNNNYTLLWEDDFSSHNEEIWNIETDGGFNGNYCDFKFHGVEFEEGMCILKMTDPVTNPETIAVTVSVDCSGIELVPSDIIYLNGSFNDWCGTCNPMAVNNEVWTTTVNLEPGDHQYLFTKNFWEENGGAPPASECDYNPCDEYYNYGVEVILDEGSIEVPTVCWGECGACDGAVGVQELNPHEPELVKITNLLGQNIYPSKGNVLLYHYSDGSVFKIVK